MSAEWEQALAALQPLRVRVHQLQLQASREHDAALQRWQQSERPVLKDHATGMKETLQLLTREEAALRQRVASLATSSVPNHPGTSTGFNVIRARVDGYGQPLSTEALRAEHDRLLKTIDVLEIDVASAKAEIMQHRRHEELEIWETKLVALQDTKRVYKDEINLIEVELLGREHFERMQRDRARAEATGEAQLRRLQEQMLQTRLKYNRAKHQYYFPKHRGWNITFGGGGIFGACKDISISEINGGVVLSAEPGGMGADGIYRPARMIWQFEAGSGGKGRHTSSSVQKAGAAQRPGSGSADSRGGSSSGSFTAGGGAAANGRPGSAPFQSAKPQPAAARSAPSLAPHLGTHDHLEASAQQQLQELSVKDYESQPLRSTSVPLLRPTVAPPHGNGSGRPFPSAGTLPAGQQQQQEHMPPDRSQSGKQGQGRGFATRFLKRLGGNKERFQGGAPPHLQPARDEDDMVDGMKQRRSLASKLLMRKTSKPGAQRSGASLERLAFGGQGLSDVARLQSSGTGNSGDDEFSVRHSHGSGGDPDELEEHGGLKAVLEGGSDGAPSGSGALSSVVELDDGDGSLASDNDSSQDGDVDDLEPLPSPLTREALQRAHFQRQDAERQAQVPHVGSGSSIPGGRSSGRGSWLRSGAAATTAAAAAAGGDAMSVLDDGASSVMELANAEGPEGASEFSAPRGVFVSGRLKGFELVGERGSKVPNLTIGQADVRATVFVRFAFEYTKGLGWHDSTRPGDRPQFHVEHLKYSIAGNNVPMPPTLIKHILRVAIPGLIQRKLLALLPREFGDYLMATTRGFNMAADVALVGPALAVLDADLGFEVRGPARSAREARKQQARYAAAKEARGLVGLTLPQAQVLAELFSGAAALLDPPRPASITQLIHLQATYERHPKLYAQLCQIIDTAYHVLAQAQGHRSDNINDFSFPGFMAGPIARMRGKPARARIVVRSIDVGLNADAILTALHDFTQRTIEEIILKGPLTDPAATLESMKAAAAEGLEVLHAWHAFALQELQHFKSKFRGGEGTVLAAADYQGFSVGVENCLYEGPLRLRVPVAMQLDQDGAFSFTVPLPGPTGSLGVFMDNFKGLTVPCHLRPPAQALNWVELTEDSEVDARMREQVATALGLIRGVLADLAAKIEANDLQKDDEDPGKALTQPRTLVSDRLGRLIVNRLKVRVRLDERRIAEILSGLDTGSMGGAFTATAGRIIGHLGDVMTLAFTPAGASPGAAGTTAAAPLPAPDRYLLRMESSDISRLRAEVQSLGFQSSVTPGGAVRLVHAVMRAAQLAFMRRPAEELEAFREQMKGWYGLMTRKALDVSVCVDTKGELSADGAFMVLLNGTADQAALRATSPLALTNEIDLVPLGKAMRGDAPEPPPAQHKL